MKAIWNRIFGAKSDRTIVAADNRYSSAVSTRSEYFDRTDTPTPCPWKDPAHGHYFGQVGL